MYILFWTCFVLNVLLWAQFAAAAGGWCVCVLFLCERRELEVVRAYEQRDNHSFQLVFALSGMLAFFINMSQIWCTKVIIMLKQPQRKLSAEKTIGAQNYRQGKLSAERTIALQNESPRRQHYPDKLGTEAQPARRASVSKGVVTIFRSCCFMIKLR
jgi:hypothetical protein